MFISIGGFAHYSKIEEAGNILDRALLAALPIFLNCLPGSEHFLTPVIIPAVLVPKKTHLIRIPQTSKGQFCFFLARCLTSLPIISFKWNYAFT
jgi:hypothetical protein